MACLTCAFGATFHLGLWAHTYTSSWSKSSGCPQCLQATHILAWRARIWAALDLGESTRGLMEETPASPVILRQNSTLSIDAFAQPRNRLSAASP
jgi:hypothetical protein